MNRIVLLLVFFYSSVLANDQVDPFSPPPDWKPEEKPELVTWVFTMNTIHRLPPGLPEDYNPMDQYDEEMNEREMSLLRYFQKKEIDFIEVDGSLICITEGSMKSIGVLYPYKYYIIIKQTEENLKKIEKHLRDKYEPELKADPVAAGQRR